MKKIICKKEYDTEKATVVKKVTSGEFGDSYMRKEIKRLETILSKLDFLIQNAE